MAGVNGKNKINRFIRYSTIIANSGSFHMTYRTYNNQLKCVRKYVPPREKKEQSFIHHTSNMYKYLHEYRNDYIIYKPLFQHIQTKGNQLKSR